MVANEKGADEVVKISSEKLLLKLLNLDSEDEVLEELKLTGIWEDQSCWKTLGGNDFENNAGIVQNQQALQSAALTEKLINSVDAVLMRAAGEREIDPRGESAPISMAKAAEVFFGIKKGDLAHLDSRKRTELAEQCIALVGTGGKQRMCLSVVDKGEGQGPEWFKNTFLRLGGSYKVDIPFVQGKFSMGGTGVLPYCGNLAFQLIVSKRHPTMLREGESADWGWTITRRNPPAELRYNQKVCKLLS